MKTIPLYGLILLFLIGMSLSGCENVSKVITSEAASTIKVGIIQPSGLAPSFTKGAELAKTQINENGGLLGMQVEFIVMDNQGMRDFPDPDESVRIAKTLIEQEEVIAILGPLLSTNSTQVGPVVTKLKTPIITGSSGHKVTATGEYVFIAVAPSSIQGATTAQFAIDPNELNAKTAATIRQEGDVYSNAVADAFEANFKGLGGDVVATEYFAHGDRNFDVQLTNINEAAPDVLLIAGFIPEVPLLAARSREIGITATFIGTNAWDIPDELFSVLDDNTPLEGAFFTRDFSIESPDAAPFVEAYTEMYKEQPDGPASWGYDAMSLLGIAIKNAGTLDTTEIRDELTKVTDYQGASTISHFDENRHPVKSLLLHTIRDGEIVLYKKVDP
ncbi:MAG: ABC transporter substrate-binding protein [Candidatus Poribacteria bacterium]|nr:ABC transporter substrate-binding protein [Candidatus Poribacteria bacterium]